MCNDLSDHPFSPENIQRELGESPSERAWLKWAARVEKLVGHSLDGDQQADGYSLDFAHDAFEAGHIPESYAADVAKAKRIRAQVAHVKAHLAGRKP